MKILYNIVSNWIIENLFFIQYKQVVHSINFFIKNKKYKNLFSKDEMNFDFDADYLNYKLVNSISHVNVYKNIKIFSLPSL